MIPVRPLVVTNDTWRPSGENCGDTFMPPRSTTGRAAPPPAGTAKMRVEYGARKPVTGANAYAISLLSGDHEKLSTYWPAGVSDFAVDGSASGCTQRRVSGGSAPAALATGGGGDPSRDKNASVLPSGEIS